jgi:pilus assembly protein CpaE
LRTAIIDLDLQFGDISYLAGREERGSLRKMEMETFAMGDAFCEPASGELLVIEAPTQPERAELLLARIPDILHRLTASCDLVIANTGSFWNDLHAKLARCCSHLVFLMDQRSTSVTACKQAMELCIRLQVPQARFLFALNGCGRYAALGTQEVSLALGGVDVCELADGGSLVDELLALGCPNELVRDGNAFATSLVPLFEQLTLECLFTEQRQPFGPEVRAGKRRGERGFGDEGGHKNREASRDRSTGWHLPDFSGLFAGKGRFGHVAP